MNQANYPSYPNYPEGQGCPAYPAYQGQPAQNFQGQQGYPAQQGYPGYTPGYYPAQAQAPAFALRQKDPRKSGALRTLNTVGLLIVAQTVLSFALQAAVSVICVAAGVNIMGDNLAMVMLSVGLSPVCTALPPLIYMVKKDWNFHLRFGRSSFIGCVLVILGGFGVCMAANIPAAVIKELLEDYGAKELPSVLGNGGGWLNFWIEFLGVAVMVPVLEEFAFRGVILSSLRRFGTGFAITASSVIFGMAHMQLSSVVFATIAGIAMGAAYVITGNLWVSVCIHAMNNGIAVIESYYYLFTGWGQSKQELLAGITMVTVCALGMLALVLLLALRKRLFPKREPMVPADGVLYAPLGAGESALTMLRSVVLWAIAAMVAVETIMLFFI